MENKLERELQKQLQTEEEKNRSEEVREKYENRYVKSAILFFGTLGVFYLFFFVGRAAFMFLFGPAVQILGVGLDWIYPLIHGAIWVAAVVSVYRQRSVADDFINRFF